MTAGEVVAILADEGLTLTNAKIQYAIHTGHLTRPEYDGAGNRVYTEEHVAQLRTYLQIPRRRGRLARRPSGVSQQPQGGVTA